MIYVQLFLVYFQIGLFSFGGGYAAMTMIHELVVMQKGWLSVAEYADLLTIAEMTPGPIAVNSATFVGQKMAGLPGAIVCTLGCVLPSILIVLTLSYLYTRYKNLSLVKDVLAQLRPAIVALIAGAAFNILLLAFFKASAIQNVRLSSLRVIEAGIFVGSLVLLRKRKAGPIAIIFGSALIGTLLYMLL